MLLKLLLETDIFISLNTLYIYIYIYIYLYSSIYLSIYLYIYIVVVVLINKNHVIRVLNTTVEQNIRI